MSVHEEPVAPGSITDRIEQQLSSLQDIQQRPLSEHAERFSAVHAQLQAALTEIDGGSS